MPHLLTDGQTKQRDKIAKQMLKILLNFDEKKFTNVVTGSETWVHYSEPVRKVSNKICTIIFYHYFRIFYLDIVLVLRLQKCIGSRYLVPLTPSTVFGRSF